MANTEQVSLYLSERERAAVREAAARIHVSENYVLKLLLRHYAGLPLTEFQEAEFQYAFPQAESHA